MKTTVDLPDDLVRTVKIRAAQENRRLKDVVAELLLRGLKADPPAGSAQRNRVRLPLIVCAQDARQEKELTPDRVAEILEADEARAALSS